MQLMHYNSRNLRKLNANFTTAVAREGLVFESYFLVLCTYASVNMKRSSSAQDVMQKTFSSQQ